MMFNFKGKEWYINKTLAMQLNSIVYNIKKDWDFVIVISGDRSVRVGKSILGMTVCSYLASLLERLDLNKDAYNLNNVHFNSRKMVEAALKSPKYTIHHYDEGREGLAAAKYSQQVQKDLLDFFAECGQLNNIFVIVLPDYFELKEDIAVGRSEFLINVYRKETPVLVKGSKLGFSEDKVPVTRLDRGFFEFFNRYKKRWLYDKAKSTRRKSYGLVKANFIGNFTDQYPLDEAEYKEKKRKALQEVKEAETQQRDSTNSKLKAGYYTLLKEVGEKNPELLKDLPLKAGLNPKYYTNRLLELKKE